MAVRRVAAAAILALTTRPTTTPTTKSSGGGTTVTTASGFAQTGSETDREAALAESLVALGLALVVAGQVERRRNPML